MRSFLRSTADVVTVLSADNTVLYDSPAIERTFGYAPGERVGAKGFDYVHPEDRGRAERAFAELLEGPRVDVPLGYRMRHKDGSWRHVEATRTNLLEDPNVGGVVVVYRDVTGRAEAEERLRFQARLLDAVGQAVVAIDLEGRITYWNRAAEDLYGWAAEEAVGRPAVEVMVPRDHADLADEVRDELLTEKIWSGEFVVRRRDGTAFPAMVTDTAVHDEQGKVVGLIGVSADITDRKKAEDALRASEERFKSLVQNASDVISVLNPDGTIRYVSPSVERILGYRPEERVGADAFGAETHPKDAEGMRETFAEGLGRPGRISPPFQFRVRRKDGSWCRMEAVATNLLEDPAVGGVVVNARDVTERAEAEERLRKSEANLARAQRLARLGSWEWDLVTGEMAWSNEAYRVLGFAPQQFVPTFERFFGVVHPDDRGVLGDKVDAALRGDEPFHLEHRLILPNGGVRTVHCRGEVTPDEDGKPLRMTGTVHDVTEIKKTERRLREAEEDQRRRARELELLHRARTALSKELDPRAVLRAVVEAVAEAYGYTLVSAYLLEGEGPDRELVMQHQVGYRSVLRRIPLSRGVMARTVRTGEPVLLEDAHADPEFLDAIQGIVSEVCVPLRDGDEVVGTLNVESTGGMALDEDDLRLIREVGEHVGVALGRARLYEQVREAEERHRALVENIPAVIYVDDADETNSVIYRSPYVREVLGYEPEEFLSDPEFWQNLLHPEDRERVLAENERTNRTGEPFRIEYRMIRKDGRAVWLRDEAVLIRDEEGRPKFWQGYFADVTERKETEGRLREAEERYRTLVENVPAMTYIQRRRDDTAGSIWVSPQVRDILGYEPEEYVSDPEFWKTVLHPDDKERVLAEDARADETGEPFSSEYRQFHKDGSVVWVRDEAAVVADEDGEPRHWLGVKTDLTGRKEAEGRLVASEARYRAVIERTTDGVFLGDFASERILEANAALGRMLGYAVEELRGMPLNHFIADDPEAIARNTRLIRERGHHFVGERRYRRKDGTLIDVETSATTIPYGDGDASCCIVRDVTERRELERELERLATHDPLTGLPNRRLVLERLRHALGRRGVPVALLFLDLDGFKVVNDSLGHGAGDRLLVAAGERIGGAVRPADTVARLGGDEFVILLEGTDREGAARAADRILAALEAPFSVNDHELSTSASVGIAVGGRDRSAGPDDLLREADLAMYQAKEKGKARHAVYDPSMDARARARLELRSGLLRALEREELVLRYQPVVSLASGEVAGLEALLRWEHPDKGTLRPGVFLAEAEEAGLGGPLLGFALGEACRLASDLAEKGTSPAGTPWVSVNLSPPQLGDPGLAGEVARTLHETGTPAEGLVLEITEDAAVEGGGKAEAALGRLKGLGAHVAVDDFGTGHSSLSHLERMPADFLKLDRAFVTNLAVDRRKAAMVRGIVDLAHALGLAVIAEGVETEGQLDILWGAGCDLAQGHLFAEPLATKDAAELAGVRAPYGRPRGENGATMADG